MKKLLVTGGAGFIGSNYIRKTLNDFQDIHIVCLDVLTYAGNLENLSDFKNHDRFEFVKGDIRDRVIVKKLFDKYHFDVVVNFAAESHVDRSIEDPEVFLTTNVIGTQVLLDIAKEKWKLEPGNKYSKEYKENVKFLQVSTDEVYGTLGAEGLFNETTHLKPNSPYSASKASADLLVRAYNKTYGLPMNITRCSNNYGPYQFPEKLIPLMINNCINDKPLPVYGDGLQVRDWIHVNDHADAINTVITNGKKGEIYNIGGNNEWTNINIVKLLIKSLHKDENLIEFVEDRPGHDRRYAIDNTKISRELGWYPKYTFENGIKETISWYQTHPKWIENVVSGDYLNYYNKMYN